MINLFYFYGIIKILSDIYLFIKNRNNNEEIKIEVGDMEKTKNMVKTASMHWLFPIVVIYPFWVVTGFFMKEWLLFIALAVEHFGFSALLAFKIMSMPRNFSRINEVAVIAIISYIEYLHFFVK